MRERESTREVYGVLVDDFGLGRLSPSMHVCPIEPGVLLGFH